jgi:tripartite-type tricarboxylate transporter receptor subunit TctC
LSALPAAAQNYPVRPITLIVPWGAGGGTDATARIIGSLLEKDLGQPVNVVNRTGGSGVVGHAAIASAQPDGYTIGLATVEIGMMHWQGLTDLTSASYTPIGLVNADPAGVQVRADSPYKTVNELLAAIKANPGKFKASGTGQGGIWHLAIAGLLRDQKTLKYVFLSLKNEKKGWLKKNAPSRPPAGQATKKFVPAAFRVVRLLVHHHTCSFETA